MNYSKKQLGGLIVGTAFSAAIVLGFQNCGPGFSTRPLASSLGADPGSSTAAAINTVIEVTPSIAQNADQVSQALAGWTGTSASSDELLLPDLKIKTSWHMKYITYSNANSGFIVANGIYSSLNENEYRVFKFDGDTASSFASVGDFTLDSSINVESINVYSEKLFLLFERLPPGATEHVARFSSDGGASWIKTDMSQIPATAYNIFGAGIRFYQDVDGQIKAQYADSTLGKVFLFSLNAQNVWVPTDSVPAPKSQLTYYETSATSTQHATFFTASTAPQTIVFQTFFPTKERVCALPVGCSLAATYYHVWSDTVVVTCNIAAVTTVFASQDGCQTFNKVFASKTGYFYVAPSSDPSVFLATFTTSDETLAKYDTTNTLDSDSRSMLIPQSLVIDFKAPANAQVKTIAQVDLLDALKQLNFWSVSPSQNFVFGRKVLQVANLAETLKLQNKIVLSPLKLNMSQATAHFTIRDIGDSRVGKLENEAQNNDRLSLIPSDLRKVTSDENGNLYFVAQSAFSAPYVVQKSQLAEKLLTQFKENGTVSDQIADLDVRNGRFCVGLSRIHYGVSGDQYGVTSTQVVFGTGSVESAADYQEFELPANGSSDIAIDCSRQLGFFTVMDNQKNYSYHRVDLKTKAEIVFPVASAGAYLSFFQDRNRNNTVAYFLDDPSMATGYLSEDGGVSFRKLALDYSSFILPSYQFDAHSAVVIDGILHMFALEPQNFGSSDPSKPANVVLHDVQTILSSGAISEKKWTMAVGGHAPILLNFVYNKTKSQIEVGVTENQDPFPFEKVIIGKTTSAGPTPASLSSHPQSFQSVFQADPIWVAGKKIFTF